MAGSSPVVATAARRLKHGKGNIVAGNPQGRPKLPVGALAFAFLKDTREHPPDAGLTHQLANLPAFGVSRVYAPDFLGAAVQDHNRLHPLFGCGHFVLGRLDSVHVRRLGVQQGAKSRPLLRDF